MMREEDLRAVVREAVERHLRGTATSPRPPDPPPLHASHGLLPVDAGKAIDDGRCLIEPGVRCSHCGYCLSYGH